MHNHDKRRVVFFGDQFASDGVLLSQANDLDRQASIILSPVLKIAATRIRNSYQSSKDKDIYEIK